MPEKPEPQHKSGAESKRSRKERLATQLRANLTKRKAQSRQRQKEQEKTGGKLEEK